MVRKREHAEILSGNVHRFTQIYASDTTVNRRREIRKRGIDYFESRSLVNEDGDEIPMQTIVEKSVSNPRNRRAELMCRISGAEEYAKLKGMDAMFLTFTCPSRMHARLSKSGMKNPKYDGTSPRSANRYLNTIWSRIRSNLSRSEVTFFGLRVAEPQHDGTPHWHILLFHDKPNFHKIQKICKFYNLQDSPDERGAANHRVDVVKIDPDRGTAAGYIAKYISKNIDGAHIDEDLYGNSAVEISERIDAWASIWGIRQFQSVGTPPISIWRELRKIKDDLPDSTLREAQKAADKSDFKEFFLIMGMSQLRETAPTVRLERIWNEELGKYGDPKGYEEFGVSDDSIVFQTRTHRWTVVENEGDVSERSVVSSQSSP